MSDVSCSLFVLVSPSVILDAAPPQARRGIRYSEASFRLSKCGEKANSDQLNVTGALGVNAL